MNNNPETKIDRENDPLWRIRQEQAYWDTAPPRHTRRAFMKIGAQLAAAIVVESLVSNVPTRWAGGRIGFTRPLWEAIESGTLDQDPQQLRAIIERDFAVKMVSPEEGTKKVKSSYNNREFDIVEWDAPRLKAVAEILGMFPAKMYKPYEGNGTKQPLRFALTEDPIWSRLLFLIPRFSSQQDWGGECACSPNTKEFRPTIILNKDALGQVYADFKDAEEVVAHEVTHYFLDNNGGIKPFVKSICEPLGIKTLGDLRKKFASVYTRSGERVKDSKGKIVISQQTMNTQALADHLMYHDKKYVRLDDVTAVEEELLKERGKKAIRSIVDMPKPMDPDYLRRNGFVHYVEFEDPPDQFQIEPENILGYGATNFNEFFPVACQYYIHGRQHFIENYSPFLGKEAARKLFENIKNVIFDGKEY